MAERRRLLIAPDRLGSGPEVQLSPEEQHYLRRVLRLRCGDVVDVIDGCGHLWGAELREPHRLQLAAEPTKADGRDGVELGLAIALIRRGIDDVMRMACELVVDRIQPLQCDRCVPQAELKPDRWESILREAVEQCERLWLPELHAVTAFEPWLGSLEARVVAGVTRVDEGVPPLRHWLDDHPQPCGTTWLLVGPEGGWSSRESTLMERNAVTPVQLGSTILRSSTAAVAGVVDLVRWREGQLNS